MKNLFITKPVHAEAHVVAGEDDPDEIPDTYVSDDAGTVARAIDYVSGMTDRFAIRDWERITP